MKGLITPGPGDMRAPEFADLLKGFDRFYPISSTWQQYRPPKATQWNNQREHMIAWFSEAEGPGAYGRKRPQTAKQTYTRLLCPPALLWIAEGAGCDSEWVKAAAREAWRKKHISAQCGTIRKFLTWDEIYWRIT